MAFRLRADDGPLIVVLIGSSLPSKKNLVKVGPPLTKLSGSARAMHFVTDIRVLPVVPIQPKTFRFPQRPPDFKNPEQRSVKPSWFDSYYDERKDLMLCIPKPKPR